MHLPFKIRDINIWLHFRQRHQCNAFRWIIWIFQHNTTTNQCYDGEAAAELFQAQAVSVTDVSGDYRVKRLLDLDLISLH